MSVYCKSGLDRNDGVCQALPFRAAQLRFCLSSAVTAVHIKDGLGLLEPRSVAVRFRLAGFPLLLMASLFLARLASVALVVLWKPLLAEAGLAGRGPPVVSTTLPTFWSYLGCFPDSPSSRILPDASYINPGAMTEDACINLCAEGDYQFAGVEFSDQCCK